MTRSASESNSSAALRSRLRCDREEPVRHRGVQIVMKRAIPRPRESAAGNSGCQRVNICATIDQQLCNVEMPEMQRSPAIFRQCIHIGTAVHHAPGAVLRQHVHRERVME